jgi:hypothetical protein
MMVLSSVVKAKVTIAPYDAKELWLGKMTKAQVRFENESEFKLFFDNPPFEEEMYYLIAPKQKDGLVIVDLIAGKNFLEAATQERVVDELVLRFEGWSYMGTVNSQPELLTPSSGVLHFSFFKDYWRELLSVLMLMVFLIGFVALKKHETRKKLIWQKRQRENWISQFESVKTTAELHQIMMRDYEFKKWLSVDAEEWKKLKTVFQEKRFSEDDKLSQELKVMIDKCIENWRTLGGV